MAEMARASRRQGLRRLRWRLSGAWLWPSFVVVTLLEMGLLHWLPIAGEGSGWIAALLLAGCLNLIAVVLIGGLGSIALRRLRPALPKVVADDRAGLAALAFVGFAFLAAGLVHRPELADEHAAFAQQSMAVRLWVDANGNDFARAHVDARRHGAGRSRSVPDVRPAGRPEALAVPDRRHVARAAAREARHEPRIECLAKSARGLQVARAAADRTLG